MCDVDIYESNIPHVSSRVLEPCSFVLDALLRMSHEKAARRLVETMNDERFFHIIMGRPLWIMFLHGYTDLLGYVKVRMRRSYTRGREYMKDSDERVLAYYTHKLSVPNLICDPNDRWNIREVCIYAAHRGIMPLFKRMAVMVSRPNMVYSAIVARNNLDMLGFMMSGDAGVTNVINPHHLRRYALAHDNQDVMDMANYIDQRLPAIHHPSYMRRVMSRARLYITKRIGEKLQG